MANQMVILDVLDIIQYFLLLVKGGLLVNAGSLRWIEDLDGAVAWERISL
jgi:hypothetical protein